MKLNLLKNFQSDPTHGSPVIATKVGYMKELKSAQGRVGKWVAT